MQKQEIYKLRQIHKIVNDQFYLLKAPQTPQQIFMHLLSHRILLGTNIIHKNLDIFFEKLKGSFAHSYLQILYASKCIENDVNLDNDKIELLLLAQRWIDSFPSIRNKVKSKCIIRNIIAVNTQGTNKINGYYNYLFYVNMISIDLWKILKNKNNQKEFHTIKHIKEDIKECYQIGGDKYDAFDLLDFVSSCLPKTMINIILDQKKLPPQLRKILPTAQCLYSNKSVQFLLRSFEDLPILLRHILIITLTLSLSKSHQKTLMEVAMKYFIIYNNQRKYCATQIVIYSFNKLSEQVRQLLRGDFLHFFKVLFKLGKTKFINFVSNNSAFIQNIALNAHLGLIGYPQQSINPLNSAKISSTIEINKGTKVQRFFQILQDYSIFCFRIQVLNLDINLSLYYLGQFTAQQSSKEILVEYERISGELKHSINVYKKGLYVLEFDNTYSWINKKILQYQYQILVPLQLQSLDKEPWISDFYDFTQLNQIADRRPIKYFKPSEQKKLEQTKYNSIQKKDRFFILKVTHKNGHYIYQTDSKQLMKIKAKNLYQSLKGQHQWRIRQNALSISASMVEDFSQIESFIEIENHSNNQANNLQDSQSPFQNKHPQKKSDNIPQYSQQI